MAMVCRSSTLSKQNTPQVIWPILIKFHIWGERLHKIFGLIGLELGLPWQYIAPKDL